MSRDEKAGYYDAGGVETIDIIRAKLTPEQFLGFLLGNAIKYQCRLNFKGDLRRDAEKLRIYASWLDRELQAAGGEERFAEETLSESGQCRCHTLPIDGSRLPEGHGKCAFCGIGVNWGAALSVYDPWTGKVLAPVCAPCARELEAKKKK